jgi:flagellar hook assembly protein FlgD
VGLISVHDISGRTIRVLESGTMQEGWKVVSWDGRDSLGKRVASGVYFLHLRLGSYAETRKIVRVQ